MTKPSDTASAEASQAVAWWSVYPTVLLFEGNITSSNLSSLAGRQVLESQPYASTDTCFFPGAAADGFYQFQVSGGGWHVGYYFFHNKYDYIGWSPQQIAHYRSKNRPPCQASVPQTMKIYTRDTLSSASYAWNTLYLNLPDQV